MTISALCLLAMALLAVNPLRADEKAQWEKHKAETIQNPNLLRYYVFEEGYGEEARNLAPSEPGKMAMSGGPPGSLYILRNSPYGVDRRNYLYKVSDLPSPEWTEGRWPWKSALTNGLEPRCVFRSGFSGEGLDSFSFEFWVRIHKTPGQKPACSIFSIGNAHNTGLSASYDSGRVTFRVASTTGVKAASAAMSDGVWHQVACGFGEGTLKLFVDGRPAAGVPFDGTYLPPVNKDFGKSAFIESRGEFLQVGGKPFSRSGEGRFDLDELAVFKGLLAEAEVAAHYASGKPAASAAEQVAAFDTLQEKTAKRNRITITLREDTWGYFPLGADIPVTVRVPAGSVDGQQCVGELLLTDIKGKEVRRERHTLAIAGQSAAVWEVRFRPERTGIYFLDAVVRDATGDILKRLPEKYCLGVTLPVPGIGEALPGNPLGLQAALDPWGFGMPFYRQFIWGPGVVEQNREQLAAFQQAGRPCFPIYTLSFDHVRYKTIGEKEEAEIRAFVTETAVGLKDVAQYWEITNEPNGKFSPETYVKLLRICSAILREKSPGVPIIAPGASPSGLPFIKEILRQGAGQYFDILSFHDYQAFPIRDGRKQQTVAKLRQILADTGNPLLPIWNSESGFFSLPRIGDRPMTGDEARRVGFKGTVTNGRYTLDTSMATAPEESAAARQVQHILFGLAAGYGKYVKCQGPSLFGTEGVNANALPSLVGVSLSALSTVLNPLAKTEELPLASQDDACVLVTARDGKRTAVLFSDGSPSLHFLTAPDQEYQGMDMLGNPLRWKTGPDGLLTVTLGENPVYLFAVPADFRQATIVKIAGPARLPENGILAGTVTVSNPFSTPIRGQLSFLPIEGGKIDLGKSAVSLEPGQNAAFPFTLTAERLKRRDYRLDAQLRDGDRLVAASSFVFTSDGALIKVPELVEPIKLDGDDTEWQGIPADIVQSEENVVHGKPNLAELWLPQWHGPDDLSFTVQCAWCEKDGLYVLLKIKDDHVMPAAPENRGLAFQWDCLEFFLDGRPYRERGGPVSTGADQVIVIPRATEQPEPCDLWTAQKDKAMVDAVFVGRRTPQGYLLEGKVTPHPGSTIKLLAGDQFCMDFLIDDTDAPESKRKTIMALHGGSDSSTNSSSWGRYQLEPAKAGGK